MADNKESTKANVTSKLPGSEATQYAHSKESPSETPKPKRQRRIEDWFPN